MSTPENAQVNDSEQFVWVSYLTTVRSESINKLQAIGFACRFDPFLEISCV